MPTVTFKTGQKIYHYHSHLNKSHSVIYLYIHLSQWFFRLCLWLYCNWR